MKKTRRIESIFEIFRVIMAVLIAYVISLVIITLISEDPLNVIKQFILGPFSTLRRFGDVLALATPFMFSGLGMCFMYAVNKFNLVGEGIFIFSACMMSWVALQLSSLPGFLLIPILLVVGMVCGVFAAAIPALLDAKFKANVVVVSLMLNSILTYFTQYMLKYVIKDSKIAISASHKLPEQSLMSILIPKTAVHGGILIAIICILIGVIIFFKTPFGFSMRTVGFNPNFARYAGLGVTGTVVAAQLVGGAFFGLGGTVEVLGRYERFQWTESPQYGFDGLLVAVLAHKNPALVPVGALLLAYIRVGADIVTRSTDIPAEFVSIVQGIIILLIAAEMFLSGFKRRLIFKSAKDDLKKEEAKA